MNYPKVSQGINNIVGDNVKLLAQLFPSAVKDGQVDFEALKEELGQFEEVDKEKFELTWAGKQDAKKMAQEDVYNRTLIYIEADSKNPETTENLYIEGNNFEVLKLLRQNYYGAIKMIYIDPPYNTGNDFVYNDKFRMNSKESDMAEGARDDEGNPLQKNQQSSNRFHANWLNMIYPRLRVAKDLLTDDGVIFISIDDNEVAQLRKISDEIFGVDNFICQFLWKSRQNKDNRNLSGVSIDHEYILCYCKNSIHRALRGSERKTDQYTNPDNDPRGTWTSANMVGLLPQDQRPNCHYDLINPYTGVNYGKPPMGWRYDKGTMNRLIEEDRILWPENAEGRPRRKSFLSEISFVLPGFSSIVGNGIYTRTGTSEMKTMFDGRFFDFPKPMELIKEFISQTTKNSDDVILDFFSGSATTAHAVMQLNAEDGGNRKYIMVQLTEKIDGNSEAHKAGYKNICEIGKERIRRAGEKIKQEIEATNAQLKIGEEPKQVPDIGFKVFRTADTNIKWNLYDEFDEVGTKRDFYSPDELDFTHGFNDIDVVYEVMLRQKDVPFSSSLEILTSIGSRTYLYGSTYLVCLETEITVELIDKLAALDPLPIKYIFRDSAFKDDINLKDEAFRRLKNLIERNSGLEKKSYTVEFI